MYMNIAIVMTMNIYITSENEQFLKSIKDEQSMSGIVNSLLNDYRAGRGGELFPPKTAKPETPKTKATEFNKVIILPETKEPEQDDYYAGLIYERATNTIWDTRMGEQEFDMTPGDVKELVRRGQVR